MTLDERLTTIIYTLNTTVLGPIGQGHAADELTDIRRDVRAATAAEIAVRGVLAERGWSARDEPVEQLVARALDHHGARKATDVVVPAVGVVHRAPDGGMSPFNCCGLHPPDVPDIDRITWSDHVVTCEGG